MNQTFVGVSLLEDENAYSGITFMTKDPETERWLQQNVMGTLVPCMQELLKAMLRHAEEAAEGPRGRLASPPFNALDWLASLLMRHNPRATRRMATPAVHPYQMKLQQHLAQQQRHFPPPALPIPHPETPKPHKPALRQQPAATEASGGGGLESSREAMDQAREGLKQRRRSEAELKQKAVEEKEGLRRASQAEAEVVD
eukprot:RCo030702